MKDACWVIVRGEFVEKEDVRFEDLLNARFG